MKEYTPIDISKKLKEKGFPQGNKNDITEKYYTISDSLKAAVMLANNEDVKWYCPTISQVLKWLRDEKNIHIVIDFFVDIDTNEIYWHYSIKDIKGKLNYISYVYNGKESYENSAIAGIEYVLDNLI